MGAGGLNRKFIKPLLIGFSKIEGLKQHLKSSEEEFCKELYSLSKDFDNLEKCKNMLKNYLNQKKVSYKNNPDVQINEIFSHFGGEIKELFKLKKTAKFICQICNQIREAPSESYFYKRKICSDNRQNFFSVEVFVQKNVNEKIDKINCPSCKGINLNVDSQSEINSLPQYLILYIESDEQPLKFYINCNLLEQPYELAIVITNTDEKKDRCNKYNVFYQKNNSWYIYNTKKSQEIRTENVLLMNCNPTIIFLERNEQKIKQLSNIVKKIKPETDIINLYKVSMQKEDKKKCFVLSKKFFDAIKLNNNNNNKDVGAEEFRVIRENIYKIKNEEYKLKFEKVDEKIANDIEYPINFVILQYRDFHEMLQFFNVFKSDEEEEKYLYEIYFGDNLIFIKVKTENSDIIVYSCHMYNNSLKVDLIFHFQNEAYLEKEILQHITNRKGLEFFFIERKLDISKTGKQEIIDKDKFHVGDMYNFTLDNNYFHEQKFSSLKADELNVKFSLMNTSEQNKNIDIYSSTMTVTKIQ